LFISHAEFSLAALGVDPAAERAYLQLVDSAAPIDAVALAARLEVPHEELARALDQLEHHLLVARSADDPPRYSARPPEPALESLVSRVGEELAQIRLYSRELQSRFREADGQSSPNELLEIVVGEREVLRHYQHLLESARHEVSVFTKPPYVVPGAQRLDVESVLRSEREGIVRGVRYRTVYEESAVDDPFTLVLAKDSVALGEEARLLADLPMKLLLMDRSIGFMPMRTEAPEAGSLIVRPSPLLDALVALFEAVWARAVPFVGDPDVTLRPELDERAMRILVLMSGGLKDDTIARVLGTSRRTVQKHVSAVMAALGARTRFQAAVLAADRGWLAVGPRSEETSSGS
jgi:DNA-binding CsgD family transcriptional regulator/sugar-specific transcriptional regulator TrmB